MELQVKDVAALFGVSEWTVFRWVEQREVPFHSVNSELRFSRAELLEWATARQKTVPPGLFHDADAPTLAGAIAAGGVHHGVGGSDVRSVLTEVVARLPLKAGADRGSVLEFLLAREASGTTAVGDGIAIPHVRSPIVLGARPAATVCFLANPVDFGAADRQKVTALFTLVTPTVRVHLQLLSRLAFALRTPDFRGAVSRAAGADELVRLASLADAAAPPRAA